MKRGDGTGEEEWGYVYKTIEYALYPSPTQRRALEATLSACGSAYNHILAECKADAIEGIPQRSYEELTSLLPGMKAADPRFKTPYAQCLQDVCRRVVRAMSGCGWNGDGDPEHLPRFKSRHRYHSFTYPSSQGFEIQGNRILLKKIGRVPYRHDYRPKGGKARTCTVSRDARGKWYAAIVFRVEKRIRSEEDLDDPAVPEGYDLGLRDVVTDTHGRKYPNPNLYSERRDEISKLQKRMQAEEKGSPGWERARRRLAAIHEDIHRRRKGGLNQLAHEMVHCHDVIVVERLSPKNMKEKADNPAVVRDRYTDASWGMLLNMVRRKAEGAGAIVIEVDPRNTSRTCSRCGHVKAVLPLSQRVYRCDQCGLVKERGDQHTGVGDAVPPRGGKRSARLTTSVGSAWDPSWARWRMGDDRTSATHAGLTSPIIEIFNSESTIQHAAK